MAMMTSQYTAPIPHSNRNYCSLLATVKTGSSCSNRTGSDNGRGVGGWGSARVTNPVSSLLTWLCPAPPFSHARAHTQNNNTQTQLYAQTEPHHSAPYSIQYFFFSASSAAMHLSAPPPPPPSAPPPPPQCVQADAATGRHNRNGHSGTEGLRKVQPSRTQQQKWKSWFVTHNTVLHN